MTISTTISPSRPTPPGSAGDYIALAVDAASRAPHTETLLPLMLEHERTRNIFEACNADEPERSQVEDKFLEAFTAMQEEVHRGTDCVTLEEAKVATRIAVKEYGTDNAVAAGLALAALAVFLGPEAVS